MKKENFLCAVIADDITGANDIGVMFAKANIETVVFSENHSNSTIDLKFTTTIIDTNSRFLEYKEAYNRVYKAVKSFDKSDVKIFYNKQCSVFRGNIGAEFDAMLDALDESNAMVIAGFPDNGRTTINGIHFVNGVELSETQFKDDPVNPMFESNLIDIIQNQTLRKVGLINFEVLDLGIKKLKKHIELIKKEYNYIVFDVRDNEDLELIAKAIEDEKVICGSSAIAYYIGLLNEEYQRTEKIINNKGKERVLTIAGSLTPQTKKQIDYMKNKNYPTIALDTRKLFTKESRKSEIDRVIKLYMELYKTNRTVLIYSLNQKLEIEETKEIGLLHGYNNAETAKLVSSTLAEITSVIKKELGIIKYLICGGDTSASFCERMGIDGMRVIEEIQPGLPACETISEPNLKFVLKSGSFGSEDFIEIAMDYL